MSYLVLARKWRPQTFSDLIGQEHVSQTLQNAIDSGRVAHAFLFTGARGVGKTSSARILAKALNCEQGLTTEPCNDCPICREITDGNSVDVFEIDGASNNGVDEIRDLRDNVKYLPAHSRYKIFIIDEVHMLSTSAFNALLKTLEEPPPHVKFIFATTEPHKVPITILSRCQRFDFKRIPLGKIVARLRFIVDREGVAISDQALAMVARKGDGSMRDSLSALDQVLAFCGEQAGDEAVADILGAVDRQLIIGAIDAVIARDSAAALSLAAKADETGCNMRSLVNEMLGTLRAMLLLKCTPGSSDLLDLADAELADCRAIAERTELADLQRYLSILLRTDSDMAHSSHGRLLLEMALVRMATLAPVIPVSDLLDRLNKLESCPPGLAGEPAAPTYRPAAAPRPAEPAATSPAKPVAAAATPSGKPDWSGFVAFVKTSKPLLAGKLAKGKPLETGNGTLQLGYPQGSLELSMLQEADSIQQLTELATGYYGRKVGVNIVAITDNDHNLPPSLEEKKTAESARNEQALREATARHPLVKAALEVFGGEITGYRKN